MAEGTDTQPRPAPAAKDGTQRKRRASRACSSCNIRKIRCDVVNTGHPCTNCRADNYDCEPLSKKGAKTPRNRQKLLDASLPTQSSLRFKPIAIAPTGSNPRLTEQAPRPQNTILRQVPHGHFLLNFTRLFASAESDGGRQKSTLLSLLAASDEGYSGPSESLRDPEDMQFLRRKGAFDLPPKPILDELISHYFKIVHPFFPILDRVAFLRDCNRIEGRDEEFGRGLSIMLVQAVLFLASSVAPMELLTKAGYKSRLQSQQVLYRRVINLYYFGYEQDIIVTIQSLLLISHYYPSMIDQKHTWHWVCQAISLSQSCGLHRDPGNSPQRHLWKRIWWAGLVRDRLQSIGSGRPMNIHSLECDVPMLVHEDVFEVGDTEDDRAVKVMFIELVKLCMCMESVLLIHTPMAEAGRVSEEDMNACMAALQDWLDNLPPEAMWQEPLLQSLGAGQIPTLYRAILHAFFNTSVIALYQPRQTVEVSEGETFQQQSQQRVRIAALDTTNLVTQLVNLDLTRYCPTYAVTITIPPLIVHLLDIRAESDVNRKKVHLGHYKLCLAFLKELGEKYWHAQFYSEFFELPALTERGVVSRKDWKPRASSPPSRLSVSDGRAPEGTDETLIGASGLLELSMQKNKDSFAQIQPSATLTDELQIPSNFAANESALPDVPLYDLDNGNADWTGFDILGDFELQIEEWLGNHGNFQNIFPSG